MKDEMQKEKLRINALEESAAVDMPVSQGGNKFNRLENSNDGDPSKADGKNIDKEKKREKGRGMQNRQALVDQEDNMTSKMVF